MTPVARMAVRRSIPPNELAPAAARGMLRRLRVEEELRSRAELVMSEIVTNAVRHAGLAGSEPIRLMVSLAPAVLRMEVIDEGAGFEPMVMRPDETQEPGGWGLWLVEKLTDRWGVDLAHSVQVWCEFDRNRG